VSGFRVALSFLTRVPAARADDGRSIAGAIPWFPVVGGLVGATVAVGYTVGALVLPRTIASCLAIALGILLTGGFHEDGLGDTADSFGGGWDRQQRLRIMKDPRLGTFGVLALSLGVLLRVTAVAALSPAVALAVIPSAHALSRGGAISLLGFLRPASEEGLGVSYSGAASRTHIGIAIVIALAIASVLSGWRVAPFAAAAAVAVAATGLLAARKIGGVTGDVLGAAQQVAEMAVLIVAVAFSTA
jgi:adenosylcobinamide-GDP ribazoletransferase